MFYDINILDLMLLNLTLIILVLKSNVNCIRLENIIRFSNIRILIIIL